VTGSDQMDSSLKWSPGQGAPRTVYLPQGMVAVVLSPGAHAIMICRSRAGTSIADPRHGPEIRIGIRAIC
jgi:hypothetical protein